MNEPLFLDAFAALLPSGMYSPGGFVPWKSGQAGPRDVAREQVLDKPYPGFGKLHIADRLSFASAALLFSGYGSCAGDETGITLGIPSGSFSADLDYMESVENGFPSPAIFSATLPSSAIADIAIYFKIKGPNRVIAGAADSGLCAFDLAAMMLHRKKASSMLVVSVDAVEPAHISSPLLPAYAAAENRAYAFLLTREKKGNGPHFRLETCFGSGEKTLSELPGESYFDKLVRQLMENKNGSVSFATKDYCGHISIEKDL
jgi:Beta-ketoacyl synthase, N-terminal domain